jgi:hypothetical protein
MRMQIAAINFELPINGAAETVVRNHSAHGSFDQEFGMTHPSRTRRLRLVSADESGKAHITFLLFLFAAEPNFLRVDHDNEIAGINVRRKNSLFFPAKKVRRFDSDLTEGLIFCVDDPPLAWNLARFCRKRFHLAGKGTEITGRVR